MSAELLRRAAQQMRELAEGATPGPWQAHQGDDPNATAQVDQSRANHLVCDVERCAEHPGKAGPDAAYIASWHPDIALGIASLFDNLAEELERVRPCEKDCANCSDMRWSWPTAELVAKDYLREEES